MAPSLSWTGREEAERLYRDLREQAALGSKRAEKGDPLGHSPVNRLICSDNLIGLSFLAEKSKWVDLIYIDPPYNTGQCFAYSDRHNSSDDWLSFLFPRLCLARDLLLPTGLFCVSIDDRESAHLGVLLQEVFGKDNHIVTIKWRKKRKPSFLSRHASSVFEYIYVFAKDKRVLPKLRGELTSEDSRPVLNHGNPIAVRTVKAGRPAKCTEQTFAPGFRQNRTLGFELLDPLEISAGRISKDCRVKGPFRVSQEILDRSVFVTKQGGLRRSIGHEEQKFRHMTDDGSAWSTNEDADQEIQRIFGNRLFPFAKPVGMLRQLIKMVPPPADKRSLHCLDFFAGTGSFGEAVFQQSLEDGITRHFTLIQSPEPFPQASIRTESTIFDLAQTRIKSLQGCIFETLILEQGDASENLVSRFQKHSENPVEAT